MRLRPWGLAALLVALAAAWGWSAAAPDRWRSQWPGTDFSRHSVPLAEIVSGGPGKDGIPPIEDPEFVAVGEAELGPRAPVLSLRLNGDARAYPLEVLVWHEIVNDRVGGVPVAVTFCPLCNSGVAFRRRLGDRVLDFGTTGLLRHSDLIMYDRQTQSWWQQYTGKAIVGELTGKRLEQLPLRMEAFERFRERRPHGRVLVPGNSWARDYGANPYAGYDGRERPLLYSGPLPRGIHPMARVVAVGDRAWPLERLRRAGEIRAGDLVLRWSPGQASALDARRIDEGRDVGNVVVRRRTGGGTEAVVHKVVFAFAFRAFHPDGTIHRGGQ